MYFRDFSTHHYAEKSLKEYYHCINEIFSRE